MNEHWLIYELLYTKYSFTDPYIYIQTHTHMHAHARARTCTHTHTRACSHTHTHTHTYIYIYIYIYIERERDRKEVDIFSRSDKMMKNKWKSGYTKTQTMDSVQNISFFFIDRTFSNKKIVFSKDY